MDLYRRIAKTIFDYFHICDYQMEGSYYCGFDHRRVFERCSCGKYRVRETNFDNVYGILPTREWLREQDIIDIHVNGKEYTGIES